MIAVKFKTKVLLLVLVVALATVSVWLIFGISNKENLISLKQDLVNQEALEDSRDATKYGVNKENVNEAFFIASQEINMGNAKNAISILDGINNNILDNNQFGKKIDLVMEAYLRLGNKDEYIKKAEYYKPLLLSKDDPLLTAKAEGLNEDYYNKLFNVVTVEADKERQ